MKKSIFNLSTALGLIFLTHSAYGMDDLKKEVSEAIASGQQKGRLYHTYDDYALNNYYEINNCDVLEKKLSSSAQPQTQTQTQTQEEVKRPLALTLSDIETRLRSDLFKAWFSTGHQRISLRDYLTVSRIDKTHYHIANSVQELIVPYEFRGNKRHNEFGNLTLPIVMPYDFLLKFTQLTRLNLKDNTVVTGDCLEKWTSHLTNLTHLSLSRNNEISEESLISYVPHLTNLTHLSLSDNKVITTDCLHHCADYWTNLTSLDLSDNQELHEWAVSYFRNLKVLNLGGLWCTISGEHLYSLTQLNELTLFANSNVKSSELIDLTGLQKLDIGGECRVNIRNLTILTGLQDLNIAENKKIRKETSLNQFPHLKHLAIDKNSPLHTEDLLLLPYLQTLTIESSFQEYRELGVDSNTPKTPQPTFYKDLEEKGVIIEYNNRYVS